IPLGCPISNKYNFPLNLLLTKYIYHPFDPKTPIGVVSLEYHILETRYSVSSTYIENEIRAIRESFKKRFLSFTENRTHIENKIIIIIDDGTLQGNMLSATLQLIKKQSPKKIIVAIPIAPIETVNIIVKEVDGLICPYIVKDL